MRERETDRSDRACVPRPETRIVGPRFVLSATRPLTWTFFRVCVVSTKAISLFIRTRLHTILVDKGCCFFATIKAGDFRSPKDVVLFVNEGQGVVLRVNTGLSTVSGSSRQKRTENRE